MLFFISNGLALVKVYTYFLEKTIFSQPHGPYKFASTTTGLKNFLAFSSACYDRQIIQHQNDLYTALYL